MKDLSETTLTTRMQKLLNSSRGQEEASFGREFNMQLISSDPERREFVLRGTTQPWMRNPDGAVHGGICAALADQAMGIIAFCIKDGETIAPTIELQVSYHRPLPPGEELQIKVHVVSATKRLIHTTAEISLAAAPEKVCFSSTATYFCK